jgi:hypothetical protein
MRIRIRIQNTGKSDQMPLPVTEVTRLSRTGTNNSNGPSDEQLTFSNELLLSLTSTFLYTVLTQLLLTLHLPTLDPYRVPYTCILKHYYCTCNNFKHYLWLFKECTGTVIPVVLFKEIFFFSYIIKCGIKIVIMYCNVTFILDENESTICCSQLFFR